MWVRIHTFTLRRLLSDFRSCVSFCSSTDLNAATCPIRSCGCTSYLTGTQEFERRRCARPNIRTEYCTFKFLTTPPPSRLSRSHMAPRVNIPQILHRASRPTKQCTFQYLSRIFFPQVLLSRQASGLSLRGKTDNRGKMITPPKKKKKARSTFRQHDLKKMEQFSLCDAMRYTLTLTLCHFYLFNRMQTAT